VRLADLHRRFGEAARLSEAFVVELSGQFLDRCAKQRLAVGEAGTVNDPHAGAQACPDCLKFGTPGRAHP
jgi:hypothetical protein